jgi:hypothetical protein
MNKIPSNENITIVCKDNGVGLLVDYNYESWERIVDLEEYKCYGCENNKDLEDLLQKSLKSEDSGEILFTFSEKTLKIEFIINLGFKKITKSLVIPKIRNITEVEKLELYVEDKFAEKDSEIKILKQKIKEQGEIVERLSDFLDYTIIGNSMVSISQTKKLKIFIWDYDSLNRTSYNYEDGASSYNFTTLVVSNDTAIDLCSNVKYLKNLEELVFLLKAGQEISDLSFLELPKLKKLVLGIPNTTPHTYIGKNPIRIPNIDKTIDVRVSGLTIVTE